MQQPTALQLQQQLQQQQRGHQLQQHLQQQQHQVQLQQQRLQQQFSRLGSKRNYNSVSESEVILATDTSDLDLTLKSTNADADGQFKKARSIRDAQAHRLIEKRRRDRMNNCLSDLDKLIQASYPEHRQGRVEKTEIIEMAIHHINFLQKHLNAQSRDTSEQFLSGYKSCRDEAVNFLLGKSNEDCLDTESMSLIAHLQNKLEKLQSETKLGTQTSSSSAAPVVNSSSPPSTVYINHLPPPTRVGTLPNSALQSLLDVKQEADPDPRQYPTLERLAFCKQELIVLNSDNVEKLSPSGSRSSSSSLSSASSVEFTKPNTSSDWLGDEVGIDNDIRRSGRRRSFSECSGVPARTYKFKNNMKVRFREDTRDVPDIPAAWNNHSGLNRVDSSNDSNNNNSMDIAADLTHGSSLNSASESKFINNSGMTSESKFVNSSGMTCKTKFINNSGMSSESKFLNNSVSIPTGSYNMNVRDSGVVKQPTPVISTMSNNAARLEERLTRVEVVEVHTRRGSGEEVSEDSGCDLPGFVLYPGYSFYIPVRVSSGFLAPFLRNFSVSSACHPVSINVNFSGPCIREVPSHSAPAYSVA